MPRATEPNDYIQIDVARINASTVICNMYTGVSCIKIAIGKHDYEYLVKMGFFIRDGKKEDSAGILNTTKSYYPEKL